MNQIPTQLNAGIADLTRPGGALDLGPARARTLTRILRMLSEGHPVPCQRAEQAIAELGVDQSQALAALDGWAEKNDNGDIVGLGLTYNPTPHQVSVDGASMWIWCAMDTLLLPTWLNKPVSIASAAPDGSGTVRLRADLDGIGELDPAGAVITWPERNSDQVDLSTRTAIWGSFCHHSFYFPSRARAEQWAAGRKEIAILDPDEGFTIATSLANALLRYEPTPTPRQP